MKTLKMALCQAVLTLSVLTMLAQSNLPPLRSQHITFSQPALDPFSGLPTSAVTICLESKGEQQCFSPPTQGPAFGLNPKAKLVQLGLGKEAILYTVEASGGGSGTAIFISLLQNSSLHASSPDLENLLPKVILTEQSQYQFWSEPVISKTKLFITANYVWNHGETHFSRHRFRISSYLFEQQNGFYELRDEYITAKKYPSLDEVDRVKVLEAERSQILLRLRRQQ